MEVIKPGYTRVTDILRPWSKFDGIPQEILDRKCAIGTEVHHAIHMHNEGFVPDLSPEAQPYFDSYLEWESASRVHCVVNEMRYYDDAKQITGCIDALARFPNEEGLVMCDWKTTAYCTPDIGITWHLQGTFYHYLIEQNKVENVSNRFLFVQLKKDGKLPKVKEFEYTTEMMYKCDCALVMHRLYNPL